MIKMCLFDRISSKGKCKPKYRADYVASGFPPQDVAILV